MAANGSTILIAVQTDDTPATYQVIPCQQTGSYSLSASLSEYTCKDTDDTQFMGGTRSRSVSVESYPDGWPLLESAPTTADRFLRKAAESGEAIVGQVMEGGAAVEEFDAYIASYEINAPVGAPMTVSMELTISGSMRTPTP